ncbi:MAG: aldo/keto reductase [Chloroflexota bacterium]|nr:aldo/keto reductase [Chloroflexota bacterium]
MKTIQLGSTDLIVSNLCLGTMQFGWTADESSSVSVLDAFVAAGGNFIDTADVYSRWSPGNPGGVSEEIIGRWMKARGNRGSIVLATKVRGEMWSGDDGQGLSRAHITRAVEDSLRRLKVETIDLYQCHWPDERTPIEETLTVFGELVAAGKVRYVGASNFGADQLADALGVVGAKNLPRFSTLQPHHNLVHRKEYEAELAALCVRENIGVIPYSPLAGGFLTGKYRKGQPLPKSQRAGRAKEYMTDQGFAVVEALDRNASAHAMSIPAVALAWELTRPAIQAPIIGANTPDQLEALLPAAELHLSTSEIESLDAISAGT